MNTEDQVNIAIIGGGILGTSIAYFLASSSAPQSSNSILLIEQEQKVSYHASARNTGKVHAPFLYDPIKKRLFAKAAFVGFNMLKEYCSLKSLPFKQDGVLEVATYDKAIDRLHKYVEWGYSNGLQENEIQFLEKEEVQNLEPNVRCLAGIHCLRDGSIDYGVVTKELMEDAKRFGCNLVTGSKVIRIVCRDRNGENGIVLYTSNGKNYVTKYLINAAGGNAVDIAHSMKVAGEYTDFHFRGEYWQAPPEYHNLTKLSIYTVPKYPEYPFLDPHWIVRVDGKREVGPNAVPVFSPYAYSLGTNIRYLIPKLFETSRTGARRIFFDRQFLLLASSELKSSISKTAMINRAREFLPQLRPSAFTQRGTAGIRSSLVDRNGKFVDDTQIVKNEYSLHLLNYNSPGATGALPIAAMVANKILEDGILTRPNSGISRTINYKKPIWDIAEISESILASAS
ncbi:MAG: FAD-dependent oxidoreductase [Candidatus Nitrosopolaris sp.]